MNQRKRVWSLLLAVLLLLSACQKSDPAPKEDTVPEKQEEEQKEEEIPLEPVESFDPSSYTNAMMLEDYDFFWTTLEENCAPLGALREVAGVDLEQIKAEGREQVTALADGDAEGFSSVLSTIAREIGGFAHILPMKPDAYYRLVEGNMWESDTQKVVFLEDAVRAFYQWQSTISPYKEQLEAAKQSNEVSEEEEEATNQAISENINLYRQGDTAVAMIKTFNFYGEKSNDAVIEMLQDFCLENLDAQDFVIDITQNFGGSTVIWSDGFAPLFAGKTLSKQDVAAYKEGDVNVQMWGGTLDSIPDLELKDLSQLTTEEYPKLNLKSLEGCDGVVARTITMDYTDEKNPDGEEFEGRIWVLVDGQVASSAEELTQCAKNSDFCTVVGKQTAGMSGWITEPAVNYFALPNSGMLIRFDAFYYLNEDGTCRDLEGTQPDIEIESGETAMQRCLKEIKKLQK